MKGAVTTAPRAEAPTLRTIAAEFVRYWTTDRTPDGCGMCGGIPHSTTCYVGRMAAVLAVHDETCHFGRDAECDCGRPPYQHCRMCGHIQIG